MSLHIVLGYNSRSPQAEPVVVYAGRSGQKSRDAIAKSTVLRFEVFDNPSGYRKNNHRAVAEPVASAPRKESALLSPGRDNKRAP